MMEIPISLRQSKLEQWPISNVMEKVALSYRGREGLLGKPPVFVTVQGEAELIRDKNEFKVHWTKDLEHWFEDGVDTPGLVLIKVRASRIHYWDGENEGEFAL